MNLRITLTLLFPALYLNPGLAFSLKSLSRKQQLSSLAATIAPDSGIPNIESQFLDFKGHTYYSEVARSKASPPFPNTKPEVILIHGFGCSSFYWRETKRYLTSAGYTVHALDLLGQGKSEKPGRAQGVVYSTDLWAQQIDSYAHKNVRNDNGIILMGNSLGGPVALAAATGDFNPLQGTTPYIASTIKGIGMYNCGIGMNSINVIRDPSWNPVQRALITFLFSLLNSLVFGNAPLISFVLDKVVTRDLLRNALTNLYQLAENPASRVDDALVDAFFGPAKESHAVEALNQIYTNDPGKTPMEFHQDNEKLKDLPIKLIWGDSDPVTPIEGSVGQFYTALDQDSDNNVSLKMVNSGHIPFDEIPECNEYMVQWLDDLVMEEKQESSAQRFQWPFGR